MEVAGTAPAGGSTRVETRAGLAREPLFWAAAAAFAGVVLGIFGMLRQAAAWDAYYVSPAARMLAEIPWFVGESLLMLSVLGVVHLLRGSLYGVWRRALGCGKVLLSLFLLAEAMNVVRSVYWNTGDRLRGYETSPFLGLEAVAMYAALFLPCVALALFAGAACRGREYRFGSMLSGLFLLAVPYVVIRLTSSPPRASEDPTSPLRLFALGLYPFGVSLLEAPLWILLGIALLRRAALRASGRAFRVREKENLLAARRLYEEGLAAGDPSVLEGLVAEDFRDARRGARGKPAMERVFAALWRSYPDLAVEIEVQKAEDDLVRTRLLLAGTDRGGVLWYPPTHRRVAFRAEFVDRFAEGRLVEHSGGTDTQGLLGQLGLPAGR